MARSFRTRGTGPKNLPKIASPSVRGARVRASAARTPRIRPALASAGYGNPPGGAAGGIPKASSPMARPASKRINRPKTGRPSRGLGKPRADFPSHI